MLVRVRPDLKRATRYFMKTGYESNVATQEMVDMAGMVVNAHRCGGQYHVEEDEHCYNWTDDMFVPACVKMT